MNFSKEQSHRVKLCHRDLGELGDATLTFGGDRTVVAMMSFPGARPGLNDCSLDLVHATTEEGDAFTLCQCKIHGLVLYAGFIVAGKIDEDRFVGFEVRYSDISEWFLRWQRITGTVGEQLTWTRPAKDLSVLVMDGSHQFALSSKYVGTSERAGEDVVLHEHVEFSFESQNGCFSIEEVRAKAIEFCSLLSILIAYPISTVSVRVRTRREGSVPTYFGTFKQLPRDTVRDFAHLCLIQKSSLDERWQSIMQNYYTDKERRDLWVRLAGMRRYEGFWEFKLLGYVALLDRYVALRVSATSNAPKPPKKRKLSRLMSRLDRLSTKLEASVTAEIVKIASEVFGHRSVTFDDQYTDAMEATDAAVRSVIDLTEDDFELIKDVRDRVAHGEPPGIRTDDHTRVSVIIGKICLLLTYWTLFDLGLSTEEFLLALNASGTRLRFEAMPNQRNLDRVTRAAVFFSINAEKYQDLASQKNIHMFSCFIEGPAGEIEFSAHYSKVCKEAFMKPTGRPQGAISWEKILGVESGAVRYVNKVYIESGSQALELHSVCILDRSRLPSQVCP